jgi:hypothetical protein
MKYEGQSILIKRYRKFFGRDLMSINPVRFSDKLYLRMILSHRSKYRIFTRLADKYLVRDFVKEKIGEKHLVKQLWHGKNPRCIPFDDLPQEYIIKTNHGWGTNIVVRGKAEKGEIINRLKDWLLKNYYWDSREYQYYNIKPRIMIEELLDDGKPDGPLDYRFWCFDGKPIVINIDNHGHTLGSYYDTDWNKLQLSSREKFTVMNVEKPENFNEMLIIASLLSANFDFVRVDLYNQHGEIYFGELTFTPGAGLFRFKPDAWDIELGERWNFRVY